MQYEKARAAGGGVEADDLQEIAIGGVPALGARREWRCSTKEPAPDGPCVWTGQPPGGGIGAFHQCGRFQRCSQPRLEPLARLEATPDVELFVEVQVFGIKKSADTRKALRFFAERRVKTHFVDLAERAASLGELKRFSQMFGVLALVDRDSKRFQDLGLAHARLSDERWLEKLADEPMLLKMPLTRFANRLTVGFADDEWRSWIEA